jgi:hypothetical protein
MFTRTLLSGVLAAGLIATMTPPPVSAETYDKLTNLTFSQRVQVPGVVLGAGTYRFRLANFESSRNVVQVLSHDGSEVYAMFHTIPDIRAEVTEEPAVTFRETPAGVPPAVNSLFYGGERRGYEFVYPRGGPLMIPEAVAKRPQPAIAYEAMPARGVEELVVEEEEIAAEAEPAPIGAKALAEPMAEQVPEPAELPRTASLAPFLALGGLASFMLGFGISLVRRRL